MSERDSDMTLTADDVLNQKFTITKFRDGYDLDQVDDFLDSIVDQFRDMEEERNEMVTQIQDLTSKLSESTASLEDLQQQLDNANAELAKKDSLPGLSAATAATTPTQSLGASEPAATPSVAAAPAPAIDFSSNADAQKSSAMLQLALELHDKYIREGEEKKQELIAAGEKAVKDMIGEANNKRAVEIAELNKTRDELQTKVDELRSFESEYRTTLKSYIEAQLRNLDVSTTGSVLSNES